MVATSEALGLFGDHEDASAAQKYLEILRRAADADLIEARKNDPKALDGMERASNTAACFAIAFHDGEHPRGLNPEMPIAIPIPKNQKKAIEWYEISIKINPSNAGSHDLLGLELTSETPPDLGRAFLHFKKSAQLGSADAMHNVGACYWNGNGIHKDQSLAVEWFRKAADLGSENAKAALSSFGYSR